jgi:type IV secretion system protein VirB9
VNYSVRGRTIVLEDVPKTILLRSGKSQATIENQRPAGQPPAAAATSATPGTIAEPAPKMAPASVVAAASPNLSPVREN